MLQWTKKTMILHDQVFSLSQKISTTKSSAEFIIVHWILKILNKILKECSQRNKSSSFIHPERMLANNYTVQSCSQIQFSMNNNNGTIGNPKFGNTQVQSSKKFIKEEFSDAM
jgi:hypothetical protein